jgi:hypothetical protein
MRRCDLLFWTTAIGCCFEIELQRLAMLQRGPDLGKAEIKDPRRSREINLVGELSPLKWPSWIWRLMKSKRNVSPVLVLAPVSSSRIAGSEVDVKGLKNGHDWGKTLVGSSN